MILRKIPILLKIFFIKPCSSLIKKIKIRLKNSGKLSISPSGETTLDSSFEGCNAISEHSFFCGHMGYGSYISSDCHIEGNIGRFTSIGPGVKCHLGIHPITSPYTSTSPMFFSLKKQNGHTFAKKQMFKEMTSPIEIGNDCWICSNVFICGGIKIADGAVVYSGAVVTKDVPPYAVVGGVPASIIKYRFDKKTIDLLLKTEWWNKPISWLQRHSESMNNVEELLSIIQDNFDEQ